MLDKLKLVEIARILFIANGAHVIIRFLATNSISALLSLSRE